MSFEPHFGLNLRENNMYVTQKTSQTSSQDAVRMCAQIGNFRYDVTRFWREFQISIMTLWQQLIVFHAWNDIIDKIIDQPKPIEYHWVLSSSLFSCLYINLVTL